MFHYVRNPERTEFPRLHTRKIGEFNCQMAHLRSNFRVDSLYDFDIEAEETVLLTFDDGLKDHYANAFRVLDRYQLSATFFVSSLPLRKAVLLDVHKIQLLLGSQPHEDLFRFLIGQLGSKRFQDYEDSEKIVSDPSRYDNRDIVLFKRLLQRDLESPLRSELLGNMFNFFFPHQEPHIARNFYMSVNELREMRGAGMVIGNHTSSHPWLGHLDLPEAMSEISECEEVLIEEGLMDRNLKVIAFPFGDSTVDLRNFLREEDYKFAFTTEPNLWNQSDFEPMRIPRLNTNDFPFE